MAAIDNEWVDGRSAIDIFVNKNNGVGLTYDDLILMPGTLKLLSQPNEAACCAAVCLVEGGSRRNTSHVEVADAREMSHVVSVKRLSDCPVSCCCCCSLARFNMQPSCLRAASMLLQ